MTESNSEVNERNLRRVVDLCYEMLEIADHGDLFRTDDGCGILYGMLRDDAYKLRQIAEREIKAHEKQVKSKKKRDEPVHSPTLFPSFGNIDKTSLKTIQ